MRFKILSLYLIITSLLGGGVIFTPKTLAATPADIIVDISPDNPKPFENTTLSLTSYAYNLDTVMITWFVNGLNASSGIGKKSFSATVGAAGSSTTVVARMAFPDGTTEKRIVLRPAEMVLLYQATDSYVPPFYKGKALPTLDSEIKVVAIPEVRSGLGYVNPKNMTYAWKKDYTNNQPGSGYGKNFFLYINDYLENANTITVVASTIDGSGSSTGSITVGTSSPSISFYKKDVKFGILWEKTIESGHTIEGDDEILIAIPYFISPKELRIPTLAFNWSINDTLVAVSEYRKQIMPLKVEAGVTGISKLGLVVENKNSLLQSASKEIDIQF